MIRALLSHLRWPLCRRAPEFQASPPWDTDEVLSIMRRAMVPVLMNNLAQENTVLSALLGRTRWQRESFTESKSRLLSELEKSWMS